jgi:hypothetical protein
MCEEILSKNEGENSSQILNEFLELLEKLNHLLNENQRNCAKIKQRLNNIPANLTNVYLFFDELPDILEDLKGNLNYISELLNIVFPLLYHFTQNMNLFIQSKVLSLYNLEKAYQKLKDCYQEMTSIPKNLAKNNHTLVLAAKGIEAVHFILPNNVN